MHPAELDNAALLNECDVRHVKRGGPGGQHRNTTQSGVVIQHRPSGLIAEANERRDQSQNLNQAVFRLRLELALGVRTVRDAPSERWQSRCRGGRIRVDVRHDDFPALLAEGLDQLAAASFDLSTAAKQLGCSPSQLLKLLALEHRALAWVNGQRSERGLPRLRPGR